MYSRMPGKGDSRSRKLRAGGAGALHLVRQLHIGLSKQCKTSLRRSAQCQSSDQLQASGDRLAFPVVCSGVPGGSAWTVGERAQEAGFLCCFRDGSGRAAGVGKRAGAYAG